MGDWETAPPPVCLKGLLLWRNSHKSFLFLFCYRISVLINILVLHVHVKMILNPKLFNHPINCFKKFFCLPSGQNDRRGTLAFFNGIMHLSVKPKEVSSVKVNRVN
jgi:hypothetical protein